MALSFNITNINSTLSGTNFGTNAFVSYQRLISPFVANTATLLSFSIDPTKQFSQTNFTIPYPTISSDATTPNNTMTLTFPAGTFTASQITTNNNSNYILYIR